MDKKLKIQAKFITKEYEMMRSKSDMLKSLLPNNNIEKFWALKGLNFSIYEGESVGIVGMNGSGKSTLLNIISEIIPPTSGELEVYGDTNIISVGDGLNLNLTGRENIIMKCEMLGMTIKDIELKIDEIIDFSGEQVKKKIDQPVKTYSSGMKSRLGFSVLVHQNPDILIIDEALSVGDAPFFEKGVNKMKEFKEQGKTILFVSHSISQVRELCDKVIWIDRGRIVKSGLTDEILNEYEDFQKRYNKLNKKERDTITKNDNKNFSLKKLEQENKDEDIKLFQKKMYDKPFSFFTKGLITFLILLLGYSLVASIKGIRFQEIFLHPTSIISIKYSIIIVVSIFILFILNTLQLRIKRKVNK